MSREMLHNESRIPLTKAEHVAVEKLLSEHAGKAVSLTRRDANESGPVLVHVDDQSFVVDSKGKVTDG